MDVQGSVSFGDVEWRIEVKACEQRASNRKHSCWGKFTALRCVMRAIRHLIRRAL